MTRSETVSDVGVLEDGPLGAPPLLLLSNAAAPLGIWDPVVPALADAYRVIRVDLLTHRNPRSGGYDVPAQARRTGATLDQLGVSQVIVIGHSSGCMTATALAEQRPDAVARLALINMGPNLDAKLPESPIFKLLAAPLLGRLLWRLRTPASIQNAARSGTARPVDIPVSFVEHAQRLTRRDVVETLRGSRDYLGERGLPDRLTPLGKPVLVIFGADDGRWRSSSSAAYRAVPGARVELLPGVGHTPMLEDPGATTELLLEFAAAAEHST